MRITADTNFFISATQWDNSVAHKLLRKLIELDVLFFTTKELLDEFANVLERDFGYNEKEADNIINKVKSFVNLIETKTKSTVIKEDPDDNKVLECALESNSEYIITYDNHLLKLKEFKKIKIMTPEEFLKIL